MYLYSLCCYLLWGISNALLVAVAIPLSFLANMIILNVMGFTLNIVVLFSLILSLGLLVDNAIVIVENIFRHRQAGKTVLKQLFWGQKRLPYRVTTSTITTAAFFPLIFMHRIAGGIHRFSSKNTHSYTFILPLSSSYNKSCFMFNIDEGKSWEGNHI